MGGGEIVLHYRWSEICGHENFIAGNTCCTEATGGAFFARSRRRAASQYVTPERPQLLKVWAIMAVNIDSGTVLVLGTPEKNFGPE